MKSIYLLIFILAAAAAGCAQDAGHNKTDHGKMHHDATGREKPARRRLKREWVFRNRRLRITS
jgi:hypothetical protein